jgi:uncharacterized alkaline shock family protein YloU
VTEPPSTAPPGTDPSGTEPPPVRIRISNTAVARVAAHQALAVPGVLALHADLGQGLLEVAGSVPRTQALPAPPTGASATVAEASATVALTVVTQLGYNCRELAQAVQRQVARAVAAYTGLAVAVTVTIADVIRD